MAKIASGLFGGMCGCAMIGQTMISVRESQACTRLSTLLAGVGFGILTTMIMFARRVAHLVRIEMVSELDVDQDGAIDIRTYRVHGQLFWASSNNLVYQFDYNDEADHILIDMMMAEIWDASTVSTLDSITQKFQDKGKTVEITGLDGPSEQRLAKLSDLIRCCYTLAVLTKLAESPPALCCVLHAIKELVSRKSCLQQHLLLQQP